MIDLDADAETFADQRITAQARHEKDLLGSAKWALRHWGQAGWFEPLLDRAAALVRRQYHEDSNKWTSPALRVAQERYRIAATKAMEKTVKPEPDEVNARAQAIAASLATSAVNLAVEVFAQESGSQVVKTWVSREDAKVRPTHAAAHGQTVPVTGNFDVGESSMDRPGDMRAPIQEWINCRCVLVLTVPDAVTAGAVAPLANEQSGDAMDPETDAPVVPSPEDRLDYTDAPVPFWGALAPEGEWSGDHRRFADGSLRSRPVPLPLAYQKTNEDRHDGSFKVANIERMWRREGLVYGMGHFLTVLPEVDEVIGVMAESGGRMGVSVDADDGTMELVLKDGRTLEQALDEMEAEEGIDLDDVFTEFTSARISGATLCNIPAFHQAFIALGDVPEEFAPTDGEDLAIESIDEQERTAASAAFVSEAPWDGSASRFTPEQWYRSCVLHRSSDRSNKSDHSLPIKEPGGALSRAGVHSAAGRLNQTNASAEQKASAKRALRGAYRQLGEDPPDSLAAAGFRVKTEDGPGWITHPVDTDRLRDWVVRDPRRIFNWGVPGDFNRCRAWAAQYVKPQYLSGYCANRHYDALGFWPGRPTSAETIAASAADYEALVAAGGEMAPALTLVDEGAVDLFTPPREWFEDPNLTGPSAVTVTEGGRVYGHLAQWGVCHIGISGVCTEAPPSPSGYAYFRTGAVLADDGSMVPVGSITMDTGHADLRARAKVAMAHYDNTGLVSANVACGEDSHGIWVAGAVPPALPPEKVYALRAAKLSGDWREIGGKLELVAALAVNVGGFPIPRTALAASGGHQISLVAAGMVMTDTGTVPAETVEEIVAKTLDAIAARAKAREDMNALREQAYAESRARMAELAERMNA